MCRLTVNRNSISFYDVGLRTGDVAAKELGAVTFGDSTVMRETLTRAPHPIKVARHYFNESGVEVAYFSFLLGSLHIFNTPRSWADATRETLAMQEVCCEH